jgi:hypothetical protein
MIPHIHPHVHRPHIQQGDMQRSIIWRDAINQSEFAVLVVFAALKKKYADKQEIVFNFVSKLTSFRIRVVHKPSPRMEQTEQKITTIFTRKKPEHNMIWQSINANIRCPRLSNILVNLELRWLKIQVITGNGPCWALQPSNPTPESSCFSSLFE